MQAARIHFYHSFWVNSLHCEIFRDRHPEFISRSDELNWMLKQVQHDHNWRY